MGERLIDGWRHWKIGADAILDAIKWMPRVGVWF